LCARETLVFGLTVLAEFLPVVLIVVPPGEAAEAERAPAERSRLLHGYVPVAHAAFDHGGVSRMLFRSCDEGIHATPIGPARPTQ
jgi:hypothetical protein